MNYSNWPNVRVIYKDIIFPTDIYVYKSYFAPYVVIYVTFKATPIKSIKFANKVEMFHLISFSFTIHVLNAYYHMTSRLGVK